MRLHGGKKYPEGDILDGSAGGYDEGMLRFDLTLVAGLEEPVEFEVVGMNGASLPVAGLTWACLYRREGESEAEALKTEHVTKGVRVSFPAMEAGEGFYELWMTDAGGREELFLRGRAVIMPALEVLEKAVVTEPRSYRVRTNADGEAWQVRQLPGRGVEQYAREAVREIKAAAEGVREELAEQVVVKHEVVEQLPEVPEANTIYYVVADDGSCVRYIVAGGELVRLDDMAAPAREHVPGVVRVVLAEGEEPEAKEAVAVYSKAATDAKFATGGGGGLEDSWDVVIKRVEHPAGSETSNGWGYRKWRSGYVESWGQFYCANPRAYTVYGVVALQSRGLHTMVTFRHAVESNYQSGDAPGVHTHTFVDGEHVAYLNIKTNYAGVMCYWRICGYALGAILPESE